MDVNSIPYQFITKMNEAKNMRERWESLYNEIDILVKQLSRDDIKLLLKYVSDRVVSDLIVSGLAECWAESIQYYNILNPDGEMLERSEENQNSWQYEDLCREVELQNR